MVDEATVRPLGRLLAEAVSEYSRSYNRKRNSAADPLQEQRSRYGSDKQELQAADASKNYIKYLWIQYADGQESIMH